jgi:hypothetical protein
MTASGSSRGRFDPGRQLCNVLPGRPTLLRAMCAQLYAARSARPNGSPSKAFLGTKNIIQKIVLNLD